GGRGREPHQEAPASEPDEGHHRRHRRQGSADPCLERGAVQPGDQEGRSRWQQDAAGRPQGAHLQGKRRAGGRVMAKEDKSKQDKPEKKGAPQQQQQAKPKKEQAPKKEAKEAAPKAPAAPEQPAP